jgi:hypothetical protein
MAPATDSLTPCQNFISRRQSDILWAMDSVLFKIADEVENAAKTTGQRFGPILW